jgi:hypothetical protein
VNIGIEAARRKIGDLVWYSWEPGRRKSHPGHGLTMIGLSTKGARELAKADVMWTSCPDHFDLVLVAALMSNTMPKLSGCYVYPSIGHFAVHESGCESKNWIRENNWQKAHVHQDTRPTAGKDMYFGLFVKENVKWSEPKLDLDHIDVWRSYWSAACSERYRAAWYDESNNERRKRQMHRVHGELCRKL